MKPSPWSAVARLALALFVPSVQAQVYDPARCGRDMPYDERDLAFCDGYFNRGHCASLKEFQACFLGQTRRRDDDRQKVERRNQAEWAQIRRKVEKMKRHC